MMMMASSSSQRQPGRDADRGQIQQAAAAAGMEPKALCDENCETFKVCLLTREQTGTN